MISFRREVALLILCILIGLIGFYSQIMSIGGIYSVLFIFGSIFILAAINGYLFATLATSLVIPVVVISGPLIGLTVAHNPRAPPVLDVTYMRWYLLAISVGLIAHLGGLFARERLSMGMLRKQE